MTTIPVDVSSADLPQVDMTKMCDFLHCHRYFFWRYERNVVAIQPKASLVYGIAIHAMLAEWHKTGSYRSAMIAFDKSWQKHGEPEGDQKRNPIRAAEMMNAYRQYYPYEKDKEQFRVIDTEVRGALPAGNFMLVVIIDLVADYYRYGLRPMDHKTTSYLNDSWWVGSNIKHQYSAYLWAMRKLFGKNCNSLEINGLLVDKTRCQFERKPTSRSDWELDDWQRQMNHVWKEVELCKAENEWPENDDYCTRWGGRSDMICQFHSLCTTVGVDYRELEPPKSQFKVEKWDPLNEVR